MEKYQLTTYSDIENNDDIQIDKENNKILLQIIDVTDKTLIEEIRHKTLVEDMRFNKLQAK